MSRFPGLFPLDTSGRLEQPQEWVLGGEWGSQYLCLSSCPPLLEGCPLSENFLVFAAPQPEEARESSRRKPCVGAGTGRVRRQPRAATALEAGTVVCIVQMRKQLRGLEGLPVLLPASSRSL